MMETLGVARDLGADHARRVRIALRTLDLAEPPASSRSTSSAHTDGQSCGQTDGSSSTGIGHFLEGFAAGHHTGHGVRD